MRDQGRPPSTPRGHANVRHRPRKPAPRRPAHDAAPVAATLTMVSGPKIGTSFRLLAPLIIGRSRDSDIRIDDPSVSRRHARIVRDEERGHALLDLGSRNGTTVRGQPVTRCRLFDGDYIGLGPVMFRFSGESRPNDVRNEPSAVDELTGALDREGFDERIAVELTRAKREEKNLWLLLLAVDDLDRRRPEAERAALRQLVSTVGRVLRADDVMARYRGAEFAILVQEADAQDPLALAERIRSLVECTPFVHEARPMPLTVSVGVAVLGDCKQPSVDQLVRLADASLYAAKISGRNCCKRFSSH
jgi:two-component system cell cycle response regulator